MPELVTTSFTTNFPSLDVRDVPLSMRYISCKDTGRSSKFMLPSKLLPPPSFTLPFATIASYSFLFSATTSPFLSIMFPIYIIPFLFSLFFSSESQVFANLVISHCCVMIEPLTGVYLSVWTDV